MTHATHAAALAAFLGINASEVTEISYNHYGLPLFEADGKEWAVGTDSEADRAAMEDIEGSIWAFNSSFILSECDLPLELSEVIGAFQSEKCESANDALLALVEKCCKDASGKEGIEAFAESAISADGRGHFLSPYDGEASRITKGKRSSFTARTRKTPVKGSFCLTRCPDPRAASEAPSRPRQNTRNTRLERCEI
jgi:hypothetical protein